jgi:PAS domain S-box-containing protein
VGSDLATTIVEWAPDGILILESDCTISFANPAAAEIFGHRREDLIGAAVETLIPGYLPFRQGSRRGECCRTSRPVHPDGDLAARRADGSDVPVELSLSPATFEGRAVTIAVVREVTSSRARELETRKLIVAQEEERIASQLQDRIIKRLFLAGLKIQSVVNLTERPVSQRLHETVDQLDTVIRDIRHTVFTGTLCDAPPGPSDPTWS